MNLDKILKLAEEFEKIANSSIGCSDCNDVHCCMNYSKSHSEMNGDTNEAKCIGQSILRLDLQDRGHFVPDIVE